MGVGTAGEGLHEHENDTPEGDYDDKNVIEDPKRVAMVEDSAIKEEDAEFDATVCEFFDH